MLWSQSYFRLLESVNENQLNKTVPKYNIFKYPE